VTRTRDAAGNYAIKLEVVACTGCDACVKSCPPQAMNLGPEIFFAQLNEVIHLH
jgi:ferredoxin